MSNQHTASHTGRSSKFPAIVKSLLGLAAASLLSIPVLADVAPLSVSGNKILAGGQPASFAGNSLFWSNNGWGGDKYYNASTVKWLKDDWKSTLVRAAMGVEAPGGYLEDANGNKSRVKAVVDAAIANDMYVIIDWHTHYAEQYQSQAIAFFQEMARTYGNKNHVIYEIYNEPLQVSWSGVVKPYAQAVVNAIRAIDPDNLIIVGTPTWSQDVDVAARDKLSGTNIAYTLHFYAGSHGQFLRDKADAALSNGAALFVTEWGTVNADGDGGVNTGETNAWVEFMKSRNLSHANWSITDKSEGASAVVPGASTNGGWNSSQLTASGTLVRNIVRNWPSAPTGNTNPGDGSGVNNATCSTISAGNTIQAENWCQMQGIQTETTSDTGGGQNLGYIDNGDWMTYSVNIPTTATYKVSYRVASLNGGGQIQIEKAGGSPVYSNINVPSTGGWQTWQTISHTVTLTAGEQLIALYAVTGGFNINWLKIEATGSTQTSSSASSNVSTTGKGWRVSGNKVLDPNGQTFLFRGINHAHNWYPNQLNQSLRDIAATGANSVRIVLSNGARWTRNSGSDVSNVISQCKTNKLVCVLEVHDATGYGEDSAAAHLSTATSYWLSSDIAAAIKGQENYAIINIANEPFGNNTNTAIYVADTKTAIKALRAGGLTHLLMVDAANWGQDWTNAMRDNAADILSTDSQGNTMFSVHMYEVYNTSQKVRDYLNSFVSRNLALVVGEFGADHYGQDVNEAAILQYTKELGVGYFGWSWSGNGSCCTNLDIVNNWNASSLTNWGNTLINSSYGVKATSKVANIFSGTTNTSSSSSTPATNPQSSSSAANTSTAQCNWGGVLFPVCNNQNWDWSWENNQSCVGRDYCTTGGYIVTSKALANNSCSWYGTIFPLCASTSNGWGWENSRSCVGINTCNSQ